MHPIIEGSRFAQHPPVSQPPRPSSPPTGLPATATRRDTLTAVALALGMLVLYHLNMGFLPGHDASGNLFLPLNLMQGDGLSFQPDAQPQMFIWRLEPPVGQVSNLSPVGQVSNLPSSEKPPAPQTRTVRVPAWDRPVDPKTLAWLARAGGVAAPGPVTWGDVRHRGALGLVAPEYFVVPSVDPPTRGYVNQYGPGAGLTALPLFAVMDVWTGGLARHPAALWYAGKFVAALCVAASIALVFLAVLPLAGRQAALAIAVVYGAGTCVWSVSSQTLWQSGPNVFFLALAVYCLMRATRNAWWAAGCGAAAGWAVVCRPTSAIVVAAIGAYLAAWAVHRVRRLWEEALTPAPSPTGRGETDGPTPWRPLAAFVLGGLPSALFLGAYNAYYLGAPWRFGQTEAGKRLAEEQLGAAGVWAGPFLEGLYGLLISPSRGMLVYSPILVFAFWGMFQAWRDPRFERLRPLGVAVVVLLVLQAKWFNWHGGWSFGYRLMVDAMPLAAVCAAAVVEPMRRHKALLGAAAVLFAWSLGVQAVGAWAYDVVGWNCREGLIVRTPDGRGIVVAGREEAVDVARRTGGAVQKVFMDVDRRAWHGRLWSIADSPLVYYVTHFAESRQAKRRLIDSVLEPP